MEIHLDLDLAYEFNQRRVQAGEIMLFMFLAAERDGLQHVEETLAVDRKRVHSMSEDQHIADRSAVYKGLLDAGLKAMFASYSPDTGDVQPNWASFGPAQGLFPAGALSARINVERGASDVRPSLHEAFERLQGGRDALSDALARHSNLLRGPGGFSAVGREEGEEQQSAAASRLAGVSSARFFRPRINVNLGSDRDRAEEARRGVRFAHLRRHLISYLHADGDQIANARRVIFGKNLTEADVVRVYNGREARLPLFGDSAFGHSLSVEFDFLSAGDVLAVCLPPGVEVDGVVDGGGRDESVYHYFVFWDESISPLAREELPPQAEPVLDRAFRNSLRLESPIETGRAVDRWRALDERIDEALRDFWENAGKVSTRRPGWRAMLRPAVLKNAPQVVHAAAREPNLDEIDVMALAQAIERAGENVDFIQALAAGLRLSDAEQSMIARIADPEARATLWDLFALSSDFLSGVRMWRLLAQRKVDIENAAVDSMKVGRLLELLEDSWQIRRVAGMMKARDDHGHSRAAVSLADAIDAGENVSLSEFIDVIDLEAQAERLMQFDLQRGEEALLEADMKGVKLSHFVDQEGAEDDAARMAARKDELTRALLAKMREASVARPHESRDGLAEREANVRRWVQLIGSAQVLVAIGRAIEEDKRYAAATHGIDIEISGLLAWADGDSSDVATRPLEPSARESLRRGLENTVAGAPMQALEQLAADALQSAERSQGGRREVYLCVAEYADAVRRAVDRRRQEIAALRNRPGGHFKDLDEQVKFLERVAFAATVTRIALDLEDFARRARQSLGEVLARTPDVGRRDPVMSRRLAEAYEGVGRWFAPDRTMRTYLRGVESAGMLASTMDEAQEIGIAPPAPGPKIERRPYAAAA